MILGATTHTVTRYAAGEWVAGRLVQGASSSFTVRGSLQPMDGETIALLPEGGRSEARKVLLCDSRQTQLQQGDRILASDGLTYRVMLVQDWTAHRPLPYRGYVLGEVTSA